MNKTFIIWIGIRSLDTGHFTNPDMTCLAAPRVLNDNGNVIGHSRVATEQITGFSQMTPTTPETFVFFKGVNNPAVSGVFSAMPNPSPLPTPSAPRCLRDG